VGTGTSLRCGQRASGVSLLSLALQDVARVPALRPDLEARDELLLTSLCQFDILACLAAIDAPGGSAGGTFYPNFAWFFSARSDPAVVMLLDDHGARAVLFHGDDEELAAALRDVASAARGESFAVGAWTGYEHPRIHQFLAEHPPTDAVR